MSNEENDPDKTYKLDNKEFEQIMVVVKEVTTRYATWVDFVDDAVRTFATWWNSPPDAEKILTQHLWPHMRDEQHKIMQDPKYGGVDFYKKLKKKAEEYHRKNGTLEPEDVEVNTEFEKNAREELKEKGFLLYMIKARRIPDIEQIIETAKNVSGDSYYISSRGFMKQTIHLFCNYWSNPYSNVNEMCEMFPYLTKKQYRHWYELNPGEKGAYMNFKKTAEAYHIKTKRRFEIDDGLGQLIKKNKTDEQYKRSHENYEREVRDVEEAMDNDNRIELDDDNPDIFTKGNLDWTKGYIEGLKNEGRFDNSDGKAILSFDETLIDTFYSRFFPIKIILTVLANMIREDDTVGGVVVGDGEPISYEDFRDKVYDEVLRISKYLKEFERVWINKDGSSGIPRNKKISTGLPLPIDSNEQEHKKIIKSEASKVRFLEYFVGVSKKQWNSRRTHNVIEKFGGAINSMGLVHITDSEDGLKITLSRCGAEFYNIDNEILHKFWNMTKPLKPINDEESKFIMENIIPKFKDEKKAVNCIKGKLVDAGNEWVFGKTLDDCFDLKEERQATMGRLAEMDLVEWVIYDKDMEKDNKYGTEYFGKSCFKLNEPLKNIW